MALNDKTLFKDTAYYYSRYRPPYPADLFKTLIKQFNLKQQDKVLDLGAGTGELAIPLSKHIASIIAVEPDKEMIREGRQQAKKAKVNNII